MKYDIAIIGGGPAGYNAAEKAAINGLKTILFEKKDLGGVCLNEGCIPTKTLLYSAKIFDSMKHASDYGISNASEPQFDLKKMISRKDKTVKLLKGGVSAKLKTTGVTVINSKAEIKGEKDEMFIITSDNKEYKAKYILLCTGSEPIIPNIKGLKDTKYWTSKEALEMTSLPEKLTIVGGGVIGIEFASFFNSLGVKVVVIEMTSEILGSMDKETSAILRKEYAKRGVEFRLDTKVLEIANTFVLVEYQGKIEKIATHQTLLSVGRKAIIENIGLDNINIKTLKNGVETNEFMQSSHPRLYACGDVTGFSQLAHTAIREGEVAINHVLGIEDKMNYHSVPSVVYTNPELAGVGKTEEELKANGTYYRVLKLPMAYSGRFMAENEGGGGIFKLIVDKDDCIIGCHMYGNPASEIIIVASMAIENKYTIEKFQKQIFPHPTVSEIFHETLYI